MHRRFPFLHFLGITVNFPCIQGIKSDDALPHSKEDSSAFLHFVRFLSPRINLESCA
jgi:hypothetical protein